VPLVLFVAFAVGYLGALDQPGGITSFAAVMTTNSVPDKVLSAWFELLGLALLVCRWIIDDCGKVGVTKPLVSGALILGFLAAAFGLLFYFVVRWFAVRETQS